MLIGGHVSIAGGFDKSIDRALAIGANCLQTFASSPRSLQTSNIPQEIIDLYLQKKAEAGMGPHYFHGVYLINLAHPGANFVQVSIDSLVFYQQFAAKIGGMGTIFHIGSHKGNGFASVSKQVITAIETVLRQTPDGVKLFLENAAGQSGAIGADLTDLRIIYDSISSDELKSKLAVCYDTQHGFASGLDLRTSDSLSQMVERIENDLGMDLIQALHVNDSLVEFNSHRDRHNNIGEGFIGNEGFRLLLSHPRFRELPFLLEVPGKDKSGPRKEDVDALKALL